MGRKLRQARERCSRLATGKSRDFLKSARARKSVIVWRCIVGPPIFHTSHDLAPQQFEEFARPKEASEVANRLLSPIETPVVVDSQDLLITASIGVAVAASAVYAPEVFRRHADVAMYHTKHQAKGV